MANTLEIKHRVQGVDEPISDNLLTVGEERCIEFLTVYVDGSEDNNSYYYTCNETWVHIIRQRNRLKLVVDANYDTEERYGIISFFHNVDADVFVDITLNQWPTEYAISLSQHNIQLKSLPYDDNGTETKTLAIECTGGRGKFGIMRPRKYERVTIDGGEDFFKEVAYDNAFELERKNDTMTIKNHGNINCIYNTDNADEDCPMEEFVTDTYYYTITVYHKDMIDVTDTVQVTFKTESEITDIPCERLNPISNRLLASLRPNTGGEGDELDHELIDFDVEDVETVNPSITCDNDELTFGCGEETKTVHFVTVPEDAPIYVSRINDFIKHYEINGHDITITVEENKFKLNRDCMLTVYNGLYSGVSMNIYLTQEGLGVG